ncbi:MAG TPA: hypothetical protein VFN61_04850 [Acidimicrobiales bacterium]|nr:hypothetical protein [Acidimicrobiales bacterium]
MTADAFVPPAVLAQLRACAARPVHAYLFVGAPGSGKRAAATQFAAMLQCANGGEDACETCERVWNGRHPDVFVFEREGASLTMDQAREVSRLSARTSTEGGPTVIVLPELQLARDAVPALLKTIEEPSGRTVFLVLADFLPPELATIASRCALVEFPPLNEAQVAAALVAGGVSPAEAHQAAALAGGRLDRARLLAGDPEAVARYEAWRSVPAKLDGTGATVAALVDDLLALLKKSASTLTARQQSEIEELARANSGAVGKVPASVSRAAGKLGAAELEARHKREQRRQRTDELRAGLAALASAYRDRAGTGAIAAGAAAEAVSVIDGFSADLAYNPGEQLGLQALFVRLGRIVL